MKNLLYHPWKLLIHFVIIFTVFFNIVGCSDHTQDGETPTITEGPSLEEVSEVPSPTLSVETSTPEPLPTETVIAGTPTPTESLTSEITPEDASSYAKRIPVVEYHDSEYQMAKNQIIMTTEWFQEQMDWLAQNNFTTLNAEELVGFVNGTFSAPERSVVLSFDVGTGEAENFKEVIIPALKEHHFTGLFFVLINAITDDGSNNTVTWSELRQWQEDGVVCVQSHGVYHPDYQLLNFNQMLWDAKTSFDIISEKVGIEPLIFAYPFDSVPEETDLVMEWAGYQLALAGHRLERSVLREDPDRYALPRYYPYSNPDYYPILSDGYGWTFSELILAAISEPTSEEEATPNAEGTVTIPISETTIPSTLTNLVTFCQYAGEDVLYQLDEYAYFPTDVSLKAQADLENPVIIKPTCHFAQPIIPEAIVLHFTEGSYTASVHEFRESELEASIHYLIDRDGTITQMVPEYFGAHHVTCYGNRALCTRSCPICEDESGVLTEPWTRSIGIELINAGRLRGEYGDFKNPDGTPFEGLVYEDYLVSFSYRYWEDYPLEQIEALRTLVYDIMARWDIPLSMVIGHSRVQLNKNDPGPALNLTWSRHGDPPREPIFSPTSPSPDPTPVPSAD
jgi:N-acetyl-anhydromuramyl-L-alanine amidase AmpD/peptidoglycan/xylan/chitin deacetylase (PgdA/CDA1 family)